MSSRFFSAGGRQSHFPPKTQVYLVHHARELRTRTYTKPQPQNQLDIGLDTEPTYL